MDGAFFGRHTHHVEITNSRLVAVTDSDVAFRWKDYRHHGNREMAPDRIRTRNTRLRMATVDLSDQTRDRPLDQSQEAGVASPRNHFQHKSISVSI